MSANEGLLPPTDAVNQQLADVLAELNKKLRTYFEIDVNQNTNAVAKLIKKISTLDTTNANLEKTLQEIPSVSREISSVLSEFKKVKEEEIYLKKQETARKEASEEFDIQKNREKNIKETFETGPGGTSGLEGLLAKSVEALFSKKSREKLIENYKEYTSVLEKESKKDPKKTAEEEKREYIDAALAKKGLKDEYSLRTIVSTSVEEELNRFSEKKDDDKKKPAVEVVLTDIDRKALIKLANLFNTGGQSDQIQPNLSVSTVPRGPNLSSIPRFDPPRTLTGPNTAPALPAGPSGPILVSGPQRTLIEPPRGPSTPRLPPAPNRPLLGPGDGDIIDIGGPRTGPSSPGRPIKNVTPTNTAGNAAKRIAGTTGRFIGSRVVPAVGAFTTGYTIGSLIREIPMFGKTLGERLDDTALSLFGLTDEQISKEASLVTPGGSLPEVPEDNQQQESAIEPAGNILEQQAEVEEPVQSDENAQKIADTLTSLTNAINTSLQSIVQEKTSREEGSTSTAVNSINNNSAVNNIVYNAENRINVNRDMFKETIKFNYKLLK